MIKNNVIDDIVDLDKGAIGTEIWYSDGKYKWSSFLHESRSNDSYIGGEPNLYMVASFGQCQFPFILIKKKIL